MCKWELAISTSDSQCWRLAGLTDANEKPWAYVRSVGPLTDNNWQWSIVDDWIAQWTGPLPFNVCKSAAEEALRQLVNPRPKDLAVSLRTITAEQRMYLAVAIAHAVGTAPWGELSAERIADFYRGADAALEHLGITVLDK